MSSAHGDQADAGWDDYAERVLRNEQRLIGLESLVSETRESDRKLIEQRSDSLADELERRAQALLELVNTRAQAVLALGTEQREADRREVVLRGEATEKRAEVTLALLSARYDAAIDKNFEQSRDAIEAMEERLAAATTKIEQMVRQWRESDREARELFAAETNRHLEQLNHNNERLAAFQAASVTRDLWQAEKDATMHRESVLRDQIVALDRTMLTMTPQAASERAHAEMIARFEAAAAASNRVMDAQIRAVAEKVDELRTFGDTSRGRSAGYASVYAAAIAAVTVLIALVGLLIAAT